MVVEEALDEEALAAGAEVVVDPHTIVALTITQEDGKALITTMEWCIIITMEMNAESMI